MINLQNTHRVNRWSTDSSPDPHNTQVVRTNGPHFGLLEPRFWSMFWNCGSRFLTVWTDGPHFGLLELGFWSMFWNYWSRASVEPKGLEALIPCIHQIDLHKQFITPNCLIEHLEKHQIFNPRNQERNQNFCIEEAQWTVSKILRISISFNFLFRIHTL